MTSNVTVRSRRLDCLGSTVQPVGASSSTLPRRSVPRPDLRCTVAWNVSPATLKKSDSVMLLDRAARQAARIALDGAVEDRVVAPRRDAGVGLERDERVRHAETAAVRRRGALYIWRLWVGYAAVPSMWMLALDTRRGRLSSPKNFRKSAGSLDTTPSSFVAVAERWAGPLPYGCRPSRLCCRGGSRLVSQAPSRRGRRRSSCRRDRR